MLKNYLKLIWRSSQKNKAHTFINISGLSVGMAVAILIGLWIWDEISFDKNFPNYDHIAQVMQKNTMNGNVMTGNSVPWPMGEALRKQFGEDFKYITMATYNNGHILAYGDKKLSVSGTYFEPSALPMLSFDMLRGDWNSLNDPSCILLSESTAKAWFGDADPRGKVLKVDNRQVVKVTGVYRDLPQNSSFGEVRFVAPWQQFADANGLTKQADIWRCNCYMNYVQLADHVDPEKVSEKIRDIKLDKVNKLEIKQKNEVFLQPMKYWHLYSNFVQGKRAGGRIQYVWLFGIIGIFVLLLACINFMNLSTARSEKRAKEVGIRKAIGSLQRQLVVQFLSESVLTALASFLLSLLLAQLALPFFNDIAGKDMKVFWNKPLFWVLGLGFTLITGLISGSYPALYLSSFRPVKVLKGTFKAGRLAALPRQVLVVLQFTVSVTLIIGTIVVFRQIQFAKDRPVGYNRDGLITLPMITGDLHKNFEAVRNELLGSGAVVSISESGSPATGDYSSNSGFDWKGKDPNEAVEFPNIDISPDYGKTIGWQIVAGRDLSTEYLSDSMAFVINETAARFIGMKNPVGETLKWDGHPFKIIGVVRDMISESPYYPVRPTLYHLLDGAGDFVTVRVNPKMSTARALETIGKVYKTYNPAQPFEYHFVDEEYGRKFGNEERIGKLASAFAGLAIFISCLGLFGMASFMAEQRVKEIGVRKVLGASVFNLWRLLSKDFLLLVLLSILIASPLAWYFMHNWLTTYGYRSDLSWWIFAMTGVGAIAITLLTVSYQSIKAALANPVKSLRTE